MECGCPATISSTEIRCVGRDWRVAVTSRLTRFESALSESIKSDLNMIYTEPPFQVDGGLDFGWFCREHTFHVFLLARLSGLESSIIDGDVVIKLDNQLCSTLGQGGHSWCKVEGVVPVDISICLNYLEGFDDVGPVFGLGQAGKSPFKVEYSQGVNKDEIQQMYRASRGSVIFIERETVTVDPLELLANPYGFLTQPPKGAMSFKEYHGDDIFDMITMHCHKLALGKCKPVSSYLDRSRGLEQIKKWNKGAGEEIRSLLI